MAVVLPVRRLQEQVKGLKAEKKKVQRDLDVALTSIDNLMREIADSRIQIAELEDELLEAKMPPITADDYEIDPSLDVISEKELDTWDG